MTETLNLNTMSPELPFRWYPVTEPFRDFLRQKTLPEGLCILNKTEEKHICIDQGLDRDFFIENFLVSDFDVYNGKVYCTVDLENVIIMGSQAVRQSVYEAIKSSPELARNPFLSRHKLFDFLENDVMQDHEKLSKIILEMGTISPVFQLTIVKYLSIRLGQKEPAQNFFGTLITQLADFYDFDCLVETLKIAKLIFNDKKSANKLIPLIKNNEEYEPRRTEVKALEHYILNKPIENNRVLQSCLAASSDPYIFRNDLRNLCIYFDFTLTQELWKKGDPEFQNIENLLNNAVIAEYLLEIKPEAEKLVAKAKKKAESFEDAISFLRYYIKTGKEKKFLYKLFTEYPLKDFTHNSITIEYLKSLKYGVGDLDEYNRIKKIILTQKTPSIFILDIAEGLHLFNSFADDLDEFFQAAKKWAEETDDFITLARWCLEYDLSRKQEAYIYLKEASEKCVNPEEHLDLGILCANNDMHELAEKHLGEAYKQADDTETILRIAETWLEQDRSKEVKKALKKAEKVAYRAVELEDIGNAWSYWFEDNKSAERCFQKASQTGWCWDDDQYNPIFGGKPSTAR